MIETKVAKVRLVHIRCQLRYRNGFVVERVGTAGGMTLWWREDIDVRIVNYSNYHIDALIEGSLASRVTLFYGSPYSRYRQKS